MTGWKSDSLNREFLNCNVLRNNFARQIFLKHGQAVMSPNTCWRMRGVGFIPGKYFSNCPMVSRIVWFFVFFILVNWQTIQIFLNNRLDTIAWTSPLASYSSKFWDFQSKTVNRNLSLCKLSGWLALQYIQSRVIASAFYY